ncbi:hypothetical protein B0H10DRAFT_1971357 [Mycena sp. CBHHK59/15]|nr:hypothetical protein B0H10DRAFT_1971357 [Mycena sp. CBHHK59/15]
MIVHRGSTAPRWKSSDVVSQVIEGRDGAVAKHSDGGSIIEEDKGVHGEWGTGRKEKKEVQDQEGDYKVTEGKLTRRSGWGGVETGRGQSGGSRGAARGATAGAMVQGGGVGCNAGWVRARESREKRAVWWRSCAGGHSAGRGRSAWQGPSVRQGVQCQAGGAVTGGGARKGGQAGQKRKAKGREGKEAGGGGPQRLPYVERCGRPRATKQVVDEVVEWVEHMPKVLAGWEGQGEPDRLLGAKWAGLCRVDGAPQHTDQQVHAPPADGRTRAECRSMVEEQADTSRSHEFSSGHYANSKPAAGTRRRRNARCHVSEGPGSYVGDHGDVDSEGESSADEGDADEMDVDDLATSVMPGALSFSSFASGGAYMDMRADVG